MIKQRLTTERAEKVFQSVQFMHLMAELIKIEFQVHMDVRFKNPVINNFASRITQSASAIQTHLAGILQAKDPEYRQDYTIELHRVFQLFVGMELEKIREFMDGVDAQIYVSDSNVLEENTPSN